jgi:glycosyltransferase involved in cell wall biosynthesis
MKYSVVIPAHNEQAYLGMLLQSLVGQTILPSQVVVVNDHSTDDTQKIAESFAENYSWISVVYLVSSEAHQPGGKVIRAFSKGLENLTADSEVIVKLDADLELPKHYFETILQHFKRDEQVGMAGGFAYILKNEDWVLENLTDKEHIRGAFKAYRKTCFEQIGGLQPAMGWDTADELKARFFGWKVVTDASLKIKHLKPTGALYESKNAHKQGEAFYTLGYGFWLTLIASAKLALLKKKPSLMFLYVKGYFGAIQNQIPMLVSPEQAQFVQKYRWKKIKEKIFK